MEKGTPPKLLKGILLIDDDSINNFINHRVIKSFNVASQIALANSGHEALVFLQSYVNEHNAYPEIILIDIHMPGMDGFEFIQSFQNVRSQAANSTIFAVLTSAAHPQDAERADSLGIQYLITKPLTKEKFEELLSKEFKYRKPLANTFTVPIIGPKEEERLKAVEKYQIVNTHPEQEFTALVQEAAEHFNVPVALVSIVDYDKVWFKANHGMDGVNYAERGVSLCSLAILQDQVTVFQNATEDPYLLANPLVHGPFGLKFYAGAPITNHEGYHIGTFCIVDKTARAFSEADKEKLTVFASRAMERIERRLAFTAPGEITS